MAFRVLPKEIETLWTLFTAPVVWAAHFLICYVGAALYCARAARLDLGFDALRVGIAAVTATALAAIVVAGLLAWRQWSFGPDDPPPHEKPTREDRLRFQGFSTLLLCGLSFLAVFFQSLPALMMTDCRP